MVEKKVSELEFKVNKIIHILHKYDTISALNYFLKNINNKFFTLEIEKPKGFKNNKKINSSITFSYQNNKFEIYIVDIKVIKNTSGNKAYLGSFLLFFNKLLALEVGVAENNSKVGEIKILWDLNNLKYAKLLKWVELLPTIVLNEKKEIANQQKKIDNENQGKPTEEITIKFDLGIYD